MRMLTVPTSAPSKLEDAKARARTGKAFMFQAVASQTWGQRYTTLFNQSRILDPQGRQITLNQAKTAFETMTKLVGNRKLFARPCPLIPCHGFIDSRVVESPEALLEIVKETVKADPNGEVLLMPYIEARYSAVQVGELITIGEGHDGVTAGKGQNVTVPSFLLPAEIHAKIQRVQTWHHKTTGIVQPHMYELIAEPGSYGANDIDWHVVQARAVKPDVEAAGTKHWGWFPKYLAYPHTFYYIVDTRIWRHATLMSHAKNPPDDMTLYIVSSMASHGACVFIEGGHSVLTAEKMHELCPDWAPHGGVGFIPPQVVIEDPPTERTEPTPEMLDRLRARFTSELGQSIRGTDDYESSLDAARWVTSASVAAKSTREWGLSGDPRLMMVLGEGLANLFRLSATACIGEARHAWRCGWGMAIKGKPLLRIHSSQQHPVPAIERQQVYSEQLHNPSIANLLRNLAVAHALFQMKWSTNAFGGPKWAAIAEVCIILYEAIREKKWDAIWPAANRLSMLTHNGGSGPLAKFSDGAFADELLVTTDAYFRINDAGFLSKGLPRYRACPDLHARLLQPGEYCTWPDGKYRVYVHFSMSFSRQQALRRLHAIGFTLGKNPPNNFPGYSDPIAHHLVLGRFKEWEPNAGGTSSVHAAGIVTISKGRPTQMQVFWQTGKLGTYYTIPPTWQFSSPRSDFYTALVSGICYKGTSLAEPSSSSVFTDYGGGDLVIFGKSFQDYLQEMLDELQEAPPKWMMKGSPWTTLPPIARAGKVDDDDGLIESGQIDVPAEGMINIPIGWAQSTESVEEDEEESVEEDEEQEDEEPCTCFDCNLEDNDESEDEEVDEDSEESED